MADSEVRRSGQSNAQGDSGQSSHFSWEQYFTDLLVHLTQETVLRYNKGKLNPAYLQSANVEKILDAM